MGFANVWISVRLRSCVRERSLFLSGVVSCGTNIGSSERAKQRGFGFEFWRPFFGGIFLAPLEEQSSVLLQFVLRMFASGSACLPERPFTSVEGTNPSYGNIIGNRPVADSEESGGERQLKVIPHNLYM